MSSLLQLQVSRLSQIDTLLEGWAINLDGLAINLDINPHTALQQRSTHTQPIHSPTPGFSSPAVRSLL